MTRIILLALMITPLLNAMEHVYLAAHTGNEQVIKDFLEHGGDPNQKDEKQKPLLHHAVKHLNIVKLLISQGANVDEPDANNDEQTVLYLAVTENDEEGQAVTRYLISEGASLEHSAKLFSHTPLYHAVGLSAENGNQVQLLLEYGANPNARGVAGQTPLHMAHGKRVISLLCRYGGDINARDNHGNTPLHATMKGISRNFWRLRFSDALSLLKHGAKPNLRTRDGSTALHFWALCDHSDYAVPRRDMIQQFFQAMKESEADFNALDAQGNTPLDEMQRNSFSAPSSLVMKAFVEQGALTGSKLREEYQAGEAKEKDRRILRWCDYIAKYGADKE